MDGEVKTVCPYCGVGCGLVASVRDGRIAAVRGDPEHPSTSGRLCLKGALVGQTVDAPTRLRQAMIRGAGGRLEPVTRGRAVMEAAARLRRVLAEHGPGSVAFYVSGQLTTEAQYLANKLAKGYLGTNHIDSNSRLCMASAAAAMRLSLGCDGPPVSYADIDDADTFVLLGSNAADCHPLLFDPILHRVRAHGARAIVVDPRRTRTAARGTLHVPLRPGTDLALLNGWLRVLADEGRIDHAFIARHTEGWAALRALLDATSPREAAAVCGIDERLLRDSAAIVGAARGLISFWAMGVSQSLTGTFTANAIINLHLATGQILRRGSGPFSLTGQPNAMGGRDVGYLSHLLPGNRTIADPTHRLEVESLWGLPEGAIAAQPGYDATAMFEALDRGALRAIWIIGTNPAATLPDLARVRRALTRAELVIVQDAYHPTETNGYAHVLLPAAVNVEQDGTFTNGERRVSLLRQVVEPPGDAAPDWWWLREIGLGLGIRELAPLSSASAIFADFARTTQGQPNDQSGIDHARLAAEGPLAWPCPRDGAPRPLHEGGRFATASGRARFWPRPYLGAGERPDARYPLLLTTGRLASHWHTRTKTAAVPRLVAAEPSPYLQMHPDDAAQLGLRDGQAVAIESRRGRARSVLRLSAETLPGLCFMPMHWNGLWTDGASPNEVTTAAADPVSSQPALKCCAVRVEADGVPGA